MTIPDEIIDDTITRSLPGDERVYPTYKIARLASLLARQGISATELTKGTGIDPSELQSAATRISRRQLIHAYRNASQLSHSPTLALEAGRALGLTDYGIYGYGLISSATLRQALEFSINYHQMATPTVRMSLFLDEDSVAVFRMEDRLDVRELYRFNIEMQFGIVSSLFSEMVGDDFRFQTIKAAFTKPRYFKAYHDMFECEVKFSTRHNDMCFDASWLERPLHRANPITAATIRKLCDQFLVEMRTRGGIVSDVYTTITKDLRTYTDVETVADAMHMSPRTLSRKLENQGTTFKAILNEVRKQLAIEFLKNTRMSTDEIADRLGFSDSANFRHAFKRWTQRTTGYYRH